ncbi:division/cell wall cluster transcriptional repressor MraZ [Neisseria sp. Ec49-e6-T10]|uniref:division/cell wall cluster transcriptional repressor MraZ n=1 Tax=Neisseria sp. Ec49-e6-T10 TaxID=3140744 RepID=UPI003EBFC69B
MFGGVSILSVDNKGRLAVPAKHREVLLRHYSPTLVVTLESNDHLLLYPEKSWTVVQEKLLKLPTGNPVLKAYQRLVLGYAESQNMDGSGRLLLPAVLRELVALNKEVALVGMGNRFELWDIEKWKTQTQEALAISRDDLAMHLGEFSL